MLGCQHLCGCFYDYHSALPPCSKAFAYPLDFSSILANSLSKGWKDIPLGKGEASESQRREELCLEPFDSLSGVIATFVKQKGF